jgi:hypothetical protein
MRGGSTGRSETGAKTVFFLVPARAARPDTQGRLTDKTPVGLPHRLVGRPADDYGRLFAHTVGLVTLDPGDAALLQRVAWDEVRRFR